MEAYILAYIGDMVVHCATSRHQHIPDMSYENSFSKFYFEVGEVFPKRGISMIEFVHPFHMLIFHRMKSIFD